MVVIKKMGTLFFMVVVFFFFCGWVGFFLPLFPFLNFSMHHHFANMSKNLDNSGSKEPFQDWVIGYGYGGYVWQDHSVDRPPHIPKLHSEILASLNFNKNKNLVPWIGEQWYIEMLFWQFFNITTCMRVVGQMPKQHFDALFFSNPGDKVLILVESGGQMCPGFSHLLRTLSPGFENNGTFKCWSDILSNNFDIYVHVGK